MVLFTHDVKKIKGAADKNGLKNATCKHTLTVITEMGSEPEIDIYI